MGTSFEEIYCLNTVIIKDPTILKLPIYQYYSLCYKQLQFAITSFMYYCLKDITLTTPYTEQEYDFIGNGINRYFQIPTLIELQNTSMYVGILDDDTGVYVENFDFIYDNVSNMIEFTVPPLDGDEILVAFYNVGSFDAALDVDEKVILAEGMNIPYLERYQNNIRSLNQIIYTKSFAVHSQAEQIKQLSNLSVMQWRERVDDLIKRYTYMKPKDGLKGLGSRGGRNAYFR